MAKQTQLFPAEQMQEDIISMENLEVPKGEVNVIDNPNLLETVDQEPKESMEPFDIAGAGKISVFSKDLGDVFELSKKKIAKKEELNKPKPVREFIGEKEKTVTTKKTKSNIAETAGYHRHHHQSGQYIRHITVPVHRTDAGSYNSTKNNKIERHGNCWRQQSLRPYTHKTPDFTR